MAWQEVLRVDDFSVGLAVQSDVNTVGSSWTWIDCLMPQLSYDAAQTDVKRARRQRGAGTKPMTGRVWPKLSIKFPAVGQLAAYAFASDTPAFGGPNLLIDYWGGSSVVAYQASGINSTDGNTMSVLTSIPKYGSLLAAREASDGAVRAMGWPKTITGTGPWAADLFEDMAALPTNGSARIPSVTKYPVFGSFSPLSVRVCGEHANQEKLYLGWYPTSFVLDFDEAWRPWWTAEGVCYGGETRGTSGGLQSITEYLALEPLVERGGARFVLGSNVFTSFNDASVDVDGTCDLRDFQFRVDIPHSVARKPKGKQGVKEVLLGSPTISASFTVPDISDFELSGEHFQEKAWRDLGETSVTFYLGDTPGRIMAGRISRGNAKAWPEPVFVDDVRHRRITVEAGPYSGDTASTDAGNKVAVLSLA